MAVASDRRAWAPGRVNLIGEHTDYTGGWALPMAIQLGTTIEATAGGGRLRLVSDDLDSMVDVALPIDDPGAVEPEWGRYPAAVAAELGSTEGVDGTVRSTLPIGAGLSSSASLEVAAALALGADLSPLDLATLCQRAEHRATGVPCGVLDQLASTAGIEGHGLLIDCETLDVTPVPIPPSVQFVVVHSGQHRTLEGSAYADRRSQCEAAARSIGPLREASLADLARLDDPMLARRARHVVTENERVHRFAAALGAEDLVAAGRLLGESHRSLRDDFEVSTERLDQLVNELESVPGVYGARLTGAGFGGCVIALCDPGVTIERGWVVGASAGARLL